MGFALGTSAYPYVLTPFNGTIHSAPIDTSNISYSSTNFGVVLERSAEEDPLYINNVEVLPGTNWDSDIDLNQHFSYYGFTNGNWGQGDYVLGDELVGNLTWYFGALVNRIGEFAGPVAPGVYDFQVAISGGDTPTANDSLALIDFQLHVVQGFDVQLVASFSNPLLQTLDQTEASVTLTNNGALPIVTSSWYVAGFGISYPGAIPEYQLTFLDFLGDWFGKTILPGQSRTDLHSKWQWGSSPAGMYYGNLGVIGGLYDGDGLHWSAENAVMQVGQPSPTVSGTITLNDFSGSLNGVEVTVEVWQDDELIETLTDTLDSSGNFGVSPTAEGWVTLKFDMRAGLKQSESVDLDEGPIEDLEIVLQNGDIDHSGEVDAADIDAAIADFGAVGDNDADVDGSTEVDAADIDVVISNFGNVDE